MRALLALLHEGYGLDYEPDGEEGRQCYLEKMRMWVNVRDIPGTLRDVEAGSAVRFFQRWKRYGFPYRTWGETPNYLVDVVDTLDPVDRAYSPRMF